MLNCATYCGLSTNKTIPLSDRTEYGAYSERELTETQVTKLHLTYNENTCVMSKQILN